MLGTVEQSAELRDGELDHRAVVLLGVDGQSDGVGEALGERVGVVAEGGVAAAALALARQETWAAAHSQFAAQPTPDRSDAAIITTTAPKRWEGEPVRTLDLNVRGLDELTAARAQMWESRTSA
ncbi:hypothetical protein [Streptomyces sp. NPDC048155]|uniref:hypothetical protein n=1 Tax=Streptomyces sp. NPDC048155 TaxID=3154818 RepID=UPI003403540F